MAINNDLDSCTISFARPEDIDGINHIRAETNADPNSPHNRLGNLSVLDLFINENTPIFLTNSVTYVCRENEKIVAYLSIDPCSFLEIFKLPQYKRNNIGRQLLQHGVEYARKLGLKKLKAGVLNDNTPALCFCHAMGFRRVGYDEDGKGMFMELDLL